MNQLTEQDFGLPRIKTAHVVQFYEDDARLVDTVAHFIGSGLEAGHAGIVIATPLHRDMLGDRLTDRGLDVAAARRRGQYLTLDAAETLSRFMVDDWPDEKRFLEVVGAVIARAGGPHPCVRAFGEMVALLWAAGQPRAAIRLEQLWNNLGRMYFFSLFCAYPSRHFADGRDTGGQQDICSAHTHVVPEGPSVG